MINVEFIYTTGTCTVGNRDYKKACNQTRTSAFKCFQWESTCTTLSASCFLTYLFSLLIVLNECTIIYTNRFTYMYHPLERGALQVYMNTVQCLQVYMHTVQCTYSYVIQVFSA